MVQHGRDDARIVSTVGEAMEPSWVRFARVALCAATAGGRMLAVGVTLVPRYASPVALDSLVVFGHTPEART